MDTLAQELLQGLECPVCFDYMVPPITLCENGHNICKICKVTLSECPTCKGSLLNVRSVVQENLIRKLMYPCKYHTDGCCEKFLLDEISEHELVCLYRPFKCPFEIVGLVKCRWEGVLEKLEEHIRNTHNTGDFIRDATGKNVYIIPKMTKKSTWGQAVFTLGEKFLFHVVTTDTYLFGYVLHVGNVNNAKKYKYRMTFKTRDGRDSFTTCRVTQSYLDDIVSIRRTENCAALSYKFIERCMDEDKKVSIDCEILKMD